MSMELDGPDGVPYKKWGWTPHVSTRATLPSTKRSARHQDAARGLGNVPRPVQVNRGLVTKDRIAVTLAGVDGDDAQGKSVRAQQRRPGAQSGRGEHSAAAVA